MSKFAKIIAFVTLTFCFSQAYHYLILGYLMQGNDDNSIFWDYVNEFGWSYNVTIDVIIAILWSIFASVWAYVSIELMVPREGKEG